MFKKKFKQGGGIWLNDGSKVFMRDSNMDTIDLSRFFNGRMSMMERYKMKRFTMGRKIWSNIKLGLDQAKKAGYNADTRKVDQPYAWRILKTFDTPESILSNKTVTCEMYFLAISEKPYYKIIAIQIFEIDTNKLLFKYAPDPKLIYSFDGKPENDINHYIEESEDGKYVKQTKIKVYVNEDEDEDDD